MDPVFQYTNSDNKWYFWDESWSQYYGPFDTQAEAQENLLKYIDCLETGTNYPQTNPHIKWRLF